jgi:hypothetical protein
MAGPGSSPYHPAMALLPEAKPPELEPDESLVGQWFADHMQGTLAQRGIVALTSRRLVFQPAKMGLVLEALKVVGGMWSKSAVAWSVPLTEVASVTALEPTTRTLEKGLPLTLTLAGGGTEEFFFVHEYADTAEKIRSAVATTE